MHTLYKDQLDHAEDVAYPHEGGVQFVAAPAALQDGREHVQQTVRSLCYVFEGGVRDID